MNNEPNNDKKYVSGDAEWTYEFEQKAPRNKKIHILNRGGISIVGNWDENAGNLAWAKLHKRNKGKEATQKNYEELNKTLSNEKRLLVA